MRDDLTRSMYARGLQNFIPPDAKDGALVDNLAMKDFSFRAGRLFRGHESLWFLRRYLSRASHEFVKAPRQCGECGVPALLSQSRQDAQLSVCPQVLILNQKPVQKSKMPRPSPAQRRT